MVKYKVLNFDFCFKIEDDECMKILYCYWMQYNDVNSRGGGVQVYQRNIINQLRANKNTKIYTLSSGIAYDGKKECYVEKLKNDGDIERFQIVNSPMLAPSKSSFYDQSMYLSDIQLKAVFRDFLQSLGGVDVIHFQSLEGFTLKVLELKEEFPQTKFIVSLHNYQCFCPQVNLWKNDEECCDDFHDGNDCLHCLGDYPSTKSFKMYYLFDYYLRKIGLSSYSKPFLGKVKQIYGKLKPQTVKKQVDASVNNHEQATIFADFRELNVSYINQYIDVVLCVSRRVREIAVHMGINPKKAKVSYIGSAFAEHQASESQKSYSGGILKMAYMGYMRHDKGFYFLLDALEHMKPELAKKVAIIIAARFDDGEAVLRAKKLQKRLADVKLYDGYTHEQIPDILEGVHLGVVPVLWEDNLPQVAIEFKAMGIPVLASDRGGPSELSDSFYFVFKNGDSHDFEEKIENFISTPDVMHDYWKKQHHLITMKEHCCQLMQVYNS